LIQIAKLGVNLSGRIAVGGSLARKFDCVSYTREEARRDPHLEEPVHEPISVAGLGL
jgi:hypothetical protein